MSTKEKNMDERIAFGNSLSEKRRESGFSQEELGLKIGKSSNAVSRYENAENTMDVHTTYLCKNCKCFKSKSI